MLLNVGFLTTISLGATIIWLISRATALALPLLLSGWSGSVSTDKTHMAATTMA
jgi:hypothetical protein